MTCRASHVLLAAAALAVLGGCAASSQSPAAAQVPAAAQTPGCLDEAAISQMARHYQARTPAANPPADMSMADARCTRARLLGHLGSQAGPLAGYKAGLTNPAVQKRFNTTEPVWGVLYERMLLPSGAVVDAAFGARALYEADLLVRVKSRAINDARTPAQVLAHLDQLIPFIELPDLMVQQPARLNGAGVTAINVGARLGVRGQPLPVPTDGPAQARLLDELRDMNVRLTDAQGQALGGGKGADVLEHPLNAVVWLAQALKAEGRALMPGQLVSLGSFSALLPPRPGLQVTARYDGLSGAQPVTVTFR